MNIRDSETIQVMNHMWIRLDRRTAEYANGVENFLSFAQGSMDTDGRIKCPCRRCGNFKQGTIQDVRNHLYFHGFDLTYTRWIWHGEPSSSSVPFYDPDFQVETEVQDYIKDVEEHMTADPVKFHQAMDDANTPLYGGCKDFSKLSAVVRLFNLKASNGWSNSSFTDLLQLLHEMLPQDNLLPTSMNDVKKMMSGVGLKYERIHSCPNDCAIYYGENADLQCCPACGTSRWKSFDEDNEQPKQIPAKVFWYLPIIPRLKSLFLNNDYARDLTWHKDGETRKVDGKMRHAADAPQWLDFDIKHPGFSSDPRNLRLGLCTDGINPFSHQSSQHSCWPVIIVIYNLPPWLTMKRRFMLLSVLISGPKQPGNNIDAYLRPLVDDLQTLWNVGVEAYDGYRNEKFMLRAALMWTVSDYPAYGNISGAVTKGYYACVICGDKTCAMRLQHGRKMAYMGHRKWLPMSHRYRRRKKAFDGHREYEEGQHHQTAEELLHLLDSLNSDEPLTNAWKRKSIFFELPYWQTLMVRHNLDVMHIEKNVCESIIGTLLNVQGKSKDSLNARLDMQVLGIKTQLAPVNTDQGFYLPPACYTLSREEKRQFCEFFHNLKVPEGYSSNIKSKVNMRELKLQNLKSHDCHVLMQQLIPVALRGKMETQVRVALTKVCYVFNQLCSKVVDIEELDSLQLQAVETLCELEIYFPPSFFDIMVHLVVHLVHEVKMCGPVFLRWMYPFERYMKTLKGMVRSKSRPEACIVECYVAEEAVQFSSEYFTKGQRDPFRNMRNVSARPGRGILGPKLLFVPEDQIKLAHLYVLRNSTIVEPYIAEHLQHIMDTFPARARSQTWVQKYHAKHFADWFRSKIVVLESNGPINDQTLKWVSHCPQSHVLSYEGYVVNGYKFDTFSRDMNLSTQNSGVTLMAESLHVSSMKDQKPIIAFSSFYGVIEDIWELDYVSMRIAVFKCKWYDPTGIKVDDMGLVTVDPNKIAFLDDPFIMATQARQVFYVEDDQNMGQHIVLQRNARFTVTGYGVDEEDMELRTFGTFPSCNMLTNEDVEPNVLGAGAGEFELVDV